MVIYIYKRKSVERARWIVVDINIKQSLNSVVRSGIANFARITYRNSGASLEGCMVDYRGTSCSRGIGIF